MIPTDNLFHNWASNMANIGICDNGEKSFLKAVLDLLIADTLRSFPVPLTT
jgi:hypothetical protein